MFVFRSYFAIFSFFFVAAPSRIRTFLLFFGLFSVGPPGNFSADALVNKLISEVDPIPTPTPCTDLS